MSYWETTAHKFFQNIGLLKKECTSMAVAKRCPYFPINWKTGDKLKHQSNYHSKYFSIYFYFMVISTMVQINADF